MFGDSHAALIDYIADNGRVTYSPETLAYVQAIFILFILTLTLHVTFSLLSYQFICWVISLTGAAVVFECCERKNHIIAYINSNGLIKSDETDWTLIESPKTLTIHEIKRISSKLIMVDQNANKKERIVEHQINQAIINNTGNTGNTGDQGINIMGSDKMEDDINFPQKYQF